MWADMCTFGVIFYGPWIWKINKTWQIEHRILPCVFFHSTGSSHCYVNQLQNIWETTVAVVSHKKWQKCFLLVVRVAQPDLVQVSGRGQEVQVFAWIYCSWKIINFTISCRFSDVALHLHKVARWLTSNLRSLHLRHFFALYTAGLFWCKSILFYHYIYSRRRCCMNKLFCILQTIYTHYAQSGLPLPCCFCVNIIIISKKALGVCVRLWEKCVWNKERERRQTCEARRRWRKFSQS